MSAPPPFADTSPSIPPEDDLPPEPPASRATGGPPPALPATVATLLDVPGAIEPSFDPHFEPAAPGAATNVWEPEEDSAITSLQRAMVGPLGAAHYLPVFARFEKVDRAGPGWNWAASLCTLNWMVFRRLWGPMLAYLGGLAGGALLVLGLGRSVFHLSQPEEISLLVALGTIAFLVPGGLGDAWLYRQYRRRSENALAQAPTLQEACALLARQASSRQRLFGVLVGNVVLAAAVFTGWSMYTAPGKSGPSTAAAPTDASARRATGSVAPAPSTPASAAMGSGSDATTVAAAVPAPPAAIAAAPATPPIATPPQPSPPPLPAPPTGPTTVYRSDTPPASDMRGATPSVRIVIAPEAPAAVGSAPPWYPSPAAMAPYVPRWREPVAQVAPTPPAQPATKPVPRANTTPATKAPDKGVPAPSAANGRFVINIGLFGDPANTQKVLATLRGAKVRLLVEELDMPNGRRTRVRAGPYATKAQADAEAARIRALKLDAVVARQ